MKNAGLPALSRVDQLSSQLARRIRRDLAAGGTYLPPERELAEEFGVSRTVVREATKRLELQGLIEVQHGVGLKLVDKLHAPISGALELLLPNEAQRLTQLIEARRIIEPEVARLAAERARPEHLRALKLSQQTLESVVDTAMAIAADLEFHRQLARAANNRICELMLESLGDLGRDSRRATIAMTGVAVVIDHHAQILRAVEARKPQAAFEAMQRHLQAAEGDLQQHFAKAKLPSHSSERAS